MAEFYLSAFADEAGGSLEEQINALSDNEISYIEPRFIDKKGVITLSDEELVDIKKRLDEKGIRVGSLGSPIGKFPIEGNFDEQLAQFERALRACEILGADRMRVFSFYVPKDKLDEYRSEVMRRMSELVRIASRRGITLCHENEEGIYGEEPERVEDLLNTVEGLSGIFDAANYCAVGSDPVRGIDVTLPHLNYVHIKDAIQKGKPGTEDSMIIVPAGDGDGRIGEALEKIDAAYSGRIMLTLEPHLYSSDAYRGVDSRNLVSVKVFDNEREAFDYAAKALKKLLSDIGFVCLDGVYKKN